ncbi:DNA helicase/exodeoxyribonuclease V, alpha subunit [secondary endosymbiont of Heteropsylla cubana]|uniref:RecBCD enzyme subunit RecD n=1 Tax=secondary endosymbiont of Heteropsylla cubana TaxID=134287 RepID=J3VTR9_9ENTR|nr:DNA helicase/exodeoxyribonuclease V, alpha subunit [secondary endosymbiont of Heteropsylla cubana]
MKSILSEAQQLSCFRSIDVQFGLMVATRSDDNQGLMLLASVWVSANTAMGHVCLPLKDLNRKNLFSGRMPELARRAWIHAGNPSLKDWKKCLLASQAVSDGSRPTPLVLEHDNLYLQRMWEYECIVANFFNQPRIIPIKLDEVRIADVLRRYFPGDTHVVNWQKVATAIAITNFVVLISGGPGTGKTSTVAKVLASLLQISNQQQQYLRIVMAAPTGKAAIRLSQSLGLALQHLELNEEQKKQLPREAVTLHRLLGLETDSQRMRYHSNNLLNLDILIIDEASMIDLPMMAHLVSAVPAKARVIFFGDHCQLSSVESGAVFKDICQFIKSGYSLNRREQLKRLTGFTLPGEKVRDVFRVSDSLCLLRKSYRFNKNSGIAKLANAINSGNGKTALKLLKSSTVKDIDYISLYNLKDYQSMIDNCIQGYQDYLRCLHNNDEPRVILESFNRFRLLCALRNGIFGVEGLNCSIEQALNRIGLITLDNGNSSYLGRPIMIMENEVSMGLYNGDIGLVLSKNIYSLCVYFPLSDGGVKEVPISLLPKHETAFSMTVHKSQGSEFERVVLVLPNKTSSLLTRELFYTAVTRVRKRFSLYARDDIVRHIISNRIQRNSGLVQRLSIKLV